MQLADRALALYGRFSPGVRDRLEAAILAGGGTVARDLTRRSDALVVGALAHALIDSGALGARLEAAGARGLPIFGERGFLAALDDKAGSPATLALATALAGTGLARSDARLFAAFDLVALDGELCRFGDAQAFRTAAELIAGGRSLGDVVRIMTRARDLAPIGRYRIALTPAGEAVLQWDDGLTSLEGQGLLSVDTDSASLDELFEAATLAESAGDLDEAARLYDMCARADRRDAIAPYNLGNIRLAQAAHEEAVLAYQRALARDAGFVEARYNLAQALEATSREPAAAIELEKVLASDPGHSDAVFNLAQLKMKGDDVGAAKALYERYLALDPPADWAATARRAILYCEARLSA